jgi:hypothetical protein
MGIGVGVRVGGGGGVCVGAGIAVFVEAGKGFELDSGAGELQPKRAKLTASSATSTTSLFLGISFSKMHQKIRVRPLRPPRIV